MADPWLLAAVIVAAWLRFGRLGDFDNSYYTATAVSMLKSWHNFLFASFDPGGVVTVDKPPVAFWVQALSVALFGPSRWAVTLPQAILGVLAVVVLYLVVRSAFGRVAAVAAAFVMAVVPASVIIDSRNEPDALLSFVLLLAAVCVVKATRSGGWKWLMAFAVLMGVAFNIKMLVAFVPLPAFLAYYVLASRQSVRTVAVKAASVTVVLLAVAFSWSAFVALTPAGERPYVGSTRDNSIWTLVFEYNGLQRFGWGKPPVGQPNQLPPKVPAPQVPNQQPLNPPAAGNPQQPLNPPLQGGQQQQQVVPQQGGVPQQPLQQGQVGGGQQAQQPPNAGAQENGLLGLFTQRLASQVGWLLPLGFLMLFVAVVPWLTEEVYRRPWNVFALLREQPGASQTLLWGGWLTTAVVVFGLARSTTTHPYYLVGLAVPMAAVAGIGFAILWRVFRDGSLLAWLAPVSIAGFVIYEAVGAGRAASDWWVAAALGVGAFAALGTAVAVWRKVTTAVLASVFMIAGALAVLLIPTAVARSAGGVVVGPVAGPQPQAPQPANPEQDRVGRVTAYIQQRDDAGTRFVVGAMSAREAAPFIISGTSAVAIGGFSGNDPIFTRDSFLAMASKGELRYFLMPSANNPPGAGVQGQQQPILNEIRTSWEDVSIDARLPGGTLYRYR